MHLGRDSGEIRASWLLTATSVVRTFIHSTTYLTGVTEDSDEKIFEELGIRKYPREVPVETEKEQTSIQPTELKLEVDLPGDTAVEAIVMQDITGNGEPDYEQRITAKDGEHTYTLSEFELHGYQIWAKLILKSIDGNNTASVKSYSLKGNKPK